jgi:CDP-diacylglycerol--glycerol-3-phosphate 3-phosphatidyltransferase
MNFVNQIPNLLGLFRIVATPLLMWLILINTPAGYLWAVILLLLMAISDYFDGKLARSLKVVSPLGIFLDTISDKIFVVGALLPMITHNLISPWIVLLVIIREFAVSGLRSYAAAEGTVISAGIWGKQKLTITVTALVWCLLEAHAATGGALGSISVLAFLFKLWPIPVALMVIWTFFSGVDYFWKAWPLLRTSWVPRSAAEPNKDVQEPVAKKG